MNENNNTNYKCYLTPQRAWWLAREDCEFRTEAERIIETAGSAECAFWMALDCGSDRKWAKKVGR
jgi:hypothetical protein